MRALFPFVLLVVATLPACTCASSEPGAPAAEAAAGAAAEPVGAATGVASARLVRGRPTTVKLNHPTLGLQRNLRAVPGVHSTALPTVAPAASAP